MEWTWIYKTLRLPRCLAAVADVDAALDSDVEAAKDDAAGSDSDSDFAEMTVTIAALRLKDKSELIADEHGHILLTRPRLPTELPKGKRSADEDDDRQQLEAFMGPDLFLKLQEEKGTNGQDDLQQTRPKKSAKKITSSCSAPHLLA